MTLSRALGVLAASLALTCAAAPAAQAANELVSYGGVVTDGSDVDDLFGDLGADLTGQAFRADILYSPDVPGTRNPMSDSDEISGGEAFLTEPVILSATFTIGGSSFSFSPNYYDDVYTSADFLDAYGYDDAGRQFQTYIVPDGGAAPTNLQTSFVDTGTGDAGGLISQYSFVSDGVETVDFDATSVSVSAAPEPRSWVLLVGGVGALGLALRRRNPAFARA